MKTNYILLIIFLFSILTSCVKEKDISPSQADNFLKMYGGYNVNEGYDLKQTSDDGYIIIGKTMIDSDNEDIILIKTDKFGNQEWGKTFDIAGQNDVGKSIVIDSDGGYVILGSATNTEANTDMYAFKTDNKGELIWSRALDKFSLNQNGTSIKTTVDGGYILVGNTEVNGVDGIHKDIYIVKLASGGNIVWEKTDGSSTEDDDANCVIENYDNKYMMIGKRPSYNNDNISNIYVTINSPQNGLVVNSNTYGNNKISEGVGIIKTEGNNYVMAGTIIEDGTKKIYVRKFGNDQSSGLQDSIWVKIYAGTGSIFAKAISSTSDNGIVIIGSEVSGTNSKTYLFKIDKDGNEVFSQTYGGDKRDEGNAVIETNDNGFAIIGTTEFDNRSMICLIKTNSVGNL